MRARTTIIASVLFLILLYLAIQRRVAEPERASEEAPRAAQAEPPAVDRVRRVPGRRVREYVPEEGLLAGYGDPKKTIVDDLRLVDNVFREYQTSFRGNPVGTNAEMMRALGGRNARKVVYVAADFSYISDGGELLDRWQTPLFFHQQSAYAMEVRSAGPDRVHWSPDDVVYPPPEAEPPVEANFP